MRKILGLFFGVMIGCFGLIVSACAPNYNNVKIEVVLPADAENNVLQLAVGEEKKFNLKITNAPNNFVNQVKLNNVDDLFTVVNCEQESGTIFYTVKGLKPGKTEVEVKTVEGNASCSMSVEVFDEVTDFSVTGEPYVVLAKDEVYVLKNQSYFSFLPLNCKKPEILYTYNNQEVKSIKIEELENGKLVAKLVGTDGTFLQFDGQDIKFNTDSINLDAQVLNYSSSTINTDIASKTVSILVVPQIETGDMKVVRKGYKNATATFYTSEQNKWVIGEGEVVTLIQNKENECYMVCEIECATKDTQVQLSSDFCECIPISAEDVNALGNYASTFANSKFFGVKALKVGDGKVQIKISYADNTTFAKTGYNKVYELNVKVVATPYQMTINNQTSFETPILLYDNAVSTYDVSIALFDTLSVFESVTVSLGEKRGSGFVEYETNARYQNLFITYKTNTQILNNFTIPYADFVNNVLATPIKIKATNKELPSDLSLIFTLNPIKVNGKAVETETITVGLPFELYEGITTFTLNEQYSEKISGQIVCKTLYMDVDQESYVFDGFEIGNYTSKKIKLSDFVFDFKDGANEIFDIEQISENGKLTKKLKITPKKVGVGTVRVTAQEGFFQDLTFSVCKKIEGANLAISPNENVTKTVLTNGNVEKIEIAYADNLTLNFSVLKTNSLANLYQIVTAVDDTFVCDVENQSDTTFDLKICGISDKSVILTTTVNKVNVTENFALEVIDEAIIFETEIQVYSPIVNVSFVEVTTNSEGKEVEKVVSGISIYRQTDVGAMYSSWAERTCKIYVTLKNGERKENVFEFFDGKIVYKTSYGDLQDKTGYYFINKFGTMEELDENTLKFVCDSTSANTGSFAFTVSITDHNETFTSQLKINVEKFTPLEYIGISNYQDTVYLSSKNPEFTFLTFMNPNADIQEFSVIFEPSETKYTDLVNVNVAGDYSKVVISHNSSKASGSGYLYFVPKTMFDKNNSFNKDKVQKIAVMYSDGLDKNFPEIISTAEDFVDAFSQTNVVAKHYVILTTIDLNGYDLSQIKNLNGSLSGGNASAKIVNVNLTLPTKISQNTNFGLFPVIESGSEINDISFEGSINGLIESIGQNNTLAVGLICGQNKGTLNNVSVVLNSTSVNICANAMDTKTENHIFVGGLTGVNFGTINNGVDAVGEKQKAQESKLLFNFDDTKTNLVAIKTTSVFDVLYYGKSSDNAVGGIAGKNEGTIFKNDELVNVYNLNNYTVNINLRTTGVERTGGVAGINSQNGVIEQQMLKGTITAKTKSDTTGTVKFGGQKLGGVVGENYGKVKSCTIRTTLSGYDYVGGVCGYENDNGLNNVANNLVQVAKTTQFEPAFTAIASNGNIGAFIGNELSGTFGGNANAKLKNNSNFAKVYYEMDVSNFVCPIAFELAGDGYCQVKESAFEFATDSIEVKKVNTSKTVFGFDDVQGIDANKIAMMFFYEAENESQQTYLFDLNANREMPFTFVNNSTIVITSLSPEILSVDSYGFVTLHKTGFVGLQISSELDNTLFDTVYVLVVNAFDSFKVRSMSGAELVSGSYLDIYSYMPGSVQYTFECKNIAMVDAFGQPLVVELKNAENFDANITFDDEPQFSSYAQYGNLLVFSTLEVNVCGIDKYLIKPVFNFSTKIKGTNITATFNSFDLLVEKEKCFELLVETKIGTKSIKSDFVMADIQPTDELEFSVLQITDDETDTLELEFIKLSDDVTVTKEYFVVLNSIREKVYDGDDNFVGFKYHYVVRFNYTNEDLLTDYEGQYYILYKALNGKTASSIINLQKQQLVSVTLKNFYKVQIVMDKITSSATNSQLIETNTLFQNETKKVASSANNILEIDVFPYFADYEYFEIVNDDANYASNNVLDIIAITVNSNKYEQYSEVKLLSGVQYVEKGVIVPASVIKSLVAEGGTLAKLYLSYSVISDAIVDTMAKMLVRAVQANGTVVYENAIALSVVVEEAVSFTIDGRAKLLNSDEYYYLAKGMTYDLTLNLFGYTEQQMKIDITTGNGIATNNVKIEKNNGKYQLVISDNITYTSTKQGYEVIIETYGENVISNKVYTSDKTKMKIMVVDYVILQDNIGTFKYGENVNEFNKNSIIKNSQGAVVYIPVGSIFTLETELIYGKTIEYDQDNEQIAVKVKNLVKTFNENATWSITACDVTLGVLEKFVKTMSLPATTTVSTSYLNISGDKIIPLRVNDSTNSNYYFNFGLQCQYVGGELVVVTGKVDDVIKLDTEFVFDVYSSSTFENALPVNSYEDLINMQDGSHYILLEDITLPNTFEPLDRAVASFDGNGHTITLPSELTFSEGDAFGLFSEVDENTVLKNIKVKVGTVTTITIVQNNTAINFGVIAGINNGTITNCCVEGSQYVSLTVSLPNQTKDFVDNYVAGLVGTNNGCITNSHVSVKFSSVANVAGFVGVNNNKIASSYVRNSSITNNSSFSNSHKTAGFVICNGMSSSGNASISTSYVCGTTNSDNIYSVSTIYAIKSKPSVSAFVYNNYSAINDCYADILICTSSTSAGFVFANSGPIIRAYTTSTFEQPGNDAYVFVRNNKIDNNDAGTYEDCLCLVGKVNESTKVQNLDGLTAFSETQGESATLFANYAISANINKTEAVWFYPYNTSENEFVKDGQKMSFTSGKLELVAPNILVSSQKVIDDKNTTFNEKTGETVYAYIETKEAVGSYLNPILIDSAQTLEQYVLAHSIKNVNSMNYRIIADIDYRTEGVVNSELYKITMTGCVEGNGMAIAGFTINTMEKCVNAGLFSQLGSGSSNMGSISNLIVQPYYINVPNASCVGTLVGRVEGGRLFNIVCDGFKYSKTATCVVGENAVGGVVGFATNSFKMQNLTSSISVNASYTYSKSKTHFVLYQSPNDLKYVSYAGNIVGIANGLGTMKNFAIEDGCVAIGEVCGLVVGHIGSNVELKTSDIVVGENNFVYASVYGGTVAGAVAGKVLNVSVGGKTANSFFNIADTQNAASVAVGGIAGFLNGGKLTTCEVAVSFVWENQAPTIIGGLIGETVGGELLNCKFSGETISATASNNNYDIKEFVVGGVIGKVAPDLSAVTDSAPEQKNLILTGVVTSGKIEIQLVNVATIYAGGVIGQAIHVYNENDKVVSSSENYVLTSHRMYKLSRVINNINIDITSVIYGGLQKIYTGGLVGAVFSDNEKLYKGEILVFDNDSLVDSSSSTGKISVYVYDNKSTATVEFYRGGILGYGYTVSEQTYILVAKTNNSWGKLLEKATKKLTSPTYADKYWSGSANISSCTDWENT